MGPSGEVGLPVGGGWAGQVEAVVALGGRPLASEAWSCSVVSQPFGGYASRA